MGRPDRGITKKNSRHRGNIRRNIPRARETSRFTSEKDSRAPGSHLIQTDSIRIREAQYPIPQADGEEELLHGQEGVDHYRPQGQKRDLDVLPGSLALEQAKEEQKKDGLEEGLRQVPPVHPGKDGDEQKGDNAERQQ